MVKHPDLLDAFRWRIFPLGARISRPGRSHRNVAQEAAVVLVPSRTGRWLRPLLVAMGLGVVIVLLVHLGSRLTDPAVLGFTDYVEYWSAGRLSARGENPYDVELLSEQQTAVGWQNDRERTRQGR